jgi:VWFA-related protein
MRHHVVLLVVVALTAALSAQDYKVEVRLVEVEVRVTDRAGAPLTDLSRADFSLKEDGVQHDVAGIQFVPPAAPIKVRWERPDGQPSNEVEEIAAPRTPTWLYIATEAAASDAPKVEAAIRAFLLAGLPPGFKVSIGGRAFSDDRTVLLSTLSRLARNPLGTEGAPGLVDVALPLFDDAAHDRAAAQTLRRQEEGTAPLQGFTSRPERVETSGGSFAQPMITSGRVDRQLPVYGDVALNQYFDIVEKLAPLPGKKAIVLMRPGLRLELDNVGLLLDLSSFAVRRRVSFYTVDSRGLEAMIPVDDRPAPLLLDRRARRQEPDLISQLEMTQLSRSGLESLARETGGKALIGTNRLTDIFDRVAQDASGYYVLSYYPIDLSSAGRYRSLRIDVNRPGARVVQATKGYYEMRSSSMFGKEDRGLKLRQAMQRAEAPLDLPVAASVGQFASADGWPVLVLSAGIPASQLQPEDARKKPYLSATAIVRVADVAGARLPLYFERRLDAPLDLARYEAVRTDRTAFVGMADMVPLLPGEYDWRMVFRDERSGRLGSAGGRVLLKDFRGPSTASTLLLTRQVVRLADIAVDGTEDQPLDAGAMRYVPQPSMVFMRGETLHLLYTVYNATPEDREAAKRGMQLALLRDGEAVGNVEAAGTPVVDGKRGQIQFTAALRTSSLEPGAYTIIGMLPNFATRATKHVEQRFLLIAPTGS